MSGHLTEAPRRMSRRGMALVAALAAAVAMSFAMASAPTASAQTVGFCTSVWLAPYGQAGDRCMQGQGAANNYIVFAVNTYARAGCVAPADYWGTQVDNWQCTGAYSTSVYYLGSKPAGSYRGIIRNNNTTKAATFGGAATCCR